MTDDVFEMVLDAVTAPVLDAGAAAPVSVPDAVEVVAETPPGVMATRLDDLSTTDFLLLLVVVLLSVDLVLRLFMRKWGFPDA